MSDPPIPLLAAPPRPQRPDHARAGVSTAPPFGVDHAFIQAASVAVDLPAETHRVGSELNEPVIDLTAKSKELVESLGPNASARLYLREEEDGYKDNTHFSEYGAGRIADLVVEGVREHNLSLVSYLR